MTQYQFHLYHNNFHHCQYQHHHLHDDDGDDDNRHASADHDRATLIAQLINKHQEQKEAFLKVIRNVILMMAKMMAMTQNIMVSHSTTNMLMADVKIEIMLTFNMI